MGEVDVDVAPVQRDLSGEMPPAVMMAHFSVLTLANTWPEGVPSGVADVLATALAQKSAARYATPDGMAEAPVTLVKSELAIPQLETVRPETRPVSPLILTTNQVRVASTRPGFILNHSWL